MTVTEYARHRGCGIQAVIYAINKGRITRREDGTVDSEQADKDWEKNTNPLKAAAGRKAAHARMRNAGQVPTPTATAYAQAAAADVDRRADSVNFAKARAARELFAARLAQLEYEERSKKLINRREVEVEAFNRARILRDACFNLPSRLAAQIAAESDPSAVHQLMESEIRKIFEDFAEGRLEQQ